jgi:O-antigen/teichoic acid export membrane protein
MVAAALPIGVGQVVALVYYRADAVLLSLLATSAEVGSYGLALRLLAPVMFLPNLVLAGGLARLSAAHADTPTAFRALLLTLLRYVLVLAVPLVAIGVPAASALVRLIGGPGFAAADGTVRLVFVATGLVFVNAVWSVALTAAGQQRLLLRLSLLGLAVNLAANLVLIPSFKAEGAAVALVLSEALSVAVSYLALRRVAGLRLAGLRYHRMLNATVIAFLVTALAPSGWTVPAAVLAGVVYLGLVVGCRFITVSEVRRLLKRPTPAATG